MKGYFLEDGSSFAEVPPQEPTGYSGMVMQDNPVPNYGGGGALHSWGGMMVTEEEHSFVVWRNEEVNFLFDATWCSRCKYCKAPFCLCKDQFPFGTFLKNMPHKEYMYDKLKSINAEVLAAHPPNALVRNRSTQIGPQ